MKERLTKLLCIKSLVTLTLTAVFAALALRGHITPQEVMTIFAVLKG